MPYVELEMLPTSNSEDQRYQIGQKTFIASREITTGDGEDVEIPVTVVGHMNGDTSIIVQFTADDDWRDVLKGEIHPVSTLLLTQG